MFRNISHVLKIYRRQLKILEISAILQLLLRPQRFASVLHYIRKNCATPIEGRQFFACIFALHFRSGSIARHESLDLQKPHVGVLTSCIDLSLSRRKTRWYNSLELFKRRYQIRAERVFVNRAKLQSFETNSNVTVKPLIRGKSSIGR